MNGIRTTDAVALLQRAAGWVAAEIEVHEALQGGPVSSSWRIDYRGEALVLRVDGPMARTLGLDRAFEATLAGALTDLVPHVRVSQPRLGVQVHAWIEGRAVSPESLSAHAKALGAWLGRLHQRSVEGRPLRPERVARRYAAALRSRRADCIAALVGDMMASMDTRHVRACHNDATAANLLIDARGALRLIDWEYAAPGDPLFDLAVPVHHHALDNNVTDALIAAWCGACDIAISTDEANARVAAYRPVYDGLLVLWSELAEQAGESDTATADAKRRALERLSQVRPELRS